MKEEKRDYALVVITKLFPPENIDDEEIEASPQMGEEEIVNPKEKEKKR
jgi:hypothetical protein